MTPLSQLQVWDLWYPQAGATGVPFARGRLDATQVLLVHAAPPTRWWKCQDLWSTLEDIGRMVILPGGEVGQLLNW
jgi:hypothetical protein